MATSVGYLVIDSINCQGLALDGDLDVLAGLNGVPGGSAPGGNGRRSPALVAGPELNAGGMRLRNGSRPGYVPVTLPWHEQPEVLLLIRSPGIDG